MELNVEEFDASLSRVEWKVGFNHFGTDNKAFFKEKFSLNHVLHPGIPPLEVKCYFLKKTYDSSSESDSNSSDIDADQCEISLQLAQAKPELKPKKKMKQDSNVADIQVEYSDLEIAYQHRPSKVWGRANGNGSEKFSMKMTESRRSPILGKWCSDTLVVETELIYSCSCSWSYEITFVVYIQFETLGEGAKSLMKNVSDMFTLQTNCDVQFCFGENQLVGGHRNILAARSRVFAAMFQHNMMESTTGRVKIEDFELDVFKELLHFIYSGRFSKILNEDLALTLMSAADKYVIEDMKKSCMNYLQQTLCTSNAIKFLISAHLQSFDILKEAAIVFIVNNRKEISQLQDWEHLTTNYPMLSILVTRRMIK